MAKVVNVFGQSVVQLEWLRPSRKIQGIPNNFAQKFLQKYLAIQQIVG